MGGLGLLGVERKKNSFFYNKKQKRICWDLHYSENAVYLANLIINHVSAASERY